MEIVPKCVQQRPSGDDKGEELIGRGHNFRTHGPTIVRVKLWHLASARAQLIDGFISKETKVAKGTEEKQIPQR